MQVALAALLAGGLIWLYAETVHGLLAQWATNPDASYGAILAGVALLVAWQRRHAIARQARGRMDAIGGALVIATGLAMHLAGLMAADLFTTRASLVVAAAGLTWFLCGTRAVAAACAPLVFLLLAIPLPDLIVTALTSSLQTMAARTAEAALSSAGVAVYRDGNVLELPATTLQIAEACSGLRSVVSLASVGVLLAWAIGGPFHRRAVLAISTVPIAVFANGLRVAASGAAAEAWGPHMTKDPWHTLAGWLTFVISLAALWVVRRALQRDGAKPAALASGCGLVAPGARA